jgi:heme A synthase
MRTAYRVLALILAAEVIVQAAAIAFGAFGLFKFIDDGAVVSKATHESGVMFDGVLGFIVHVINGYMVIPGLALAFLVVAFFARIPGGVKWAAIVFGLVVVQILLGGLAHGLPAIGALHGANALALFIAAVVAARLVTRPQPKPSAEVAEAQVGSGVPR